jgi:putative aldouronate transport system permease protein
MKQLTNRRLWNKVLAQKALFFMILPCMLLTFIFSYYPLVGWIMAFENFKPAKGYFGSDFVGMEQFRFLFSTSEFWLTIRNTLAMSTINLVLGFLFAIVFALLLNEIKSLGFKKVTQTVSYLPHFLSWVIVCSLIANILSSSDGTLNNVLMAFGIIDEPVLWLGQIDLFWWISGFSNVWKEMGWDSIIYIAAMAGIDSALYEAAEIDGANRYRRMWHVTLPCIRPTIIIITVMKLGWLLNAGFEIPYLLGGGLVQDVSQTIDIFVLQFGLSIGNYSLATAAGMFKSVVSIILVAGTSILSSRLGDEKLF